MPPIIRRMSSPAVTPFMTSSPQFAPHRSRTMRKRLIAAFYWSILHAHNKGRATVLDHYRADGSFCRRCTHWRIVKARTIMVGHWLSSWRKCLSGDDNATVF